MKRHYVSAAALRELFVQLSPRDLAVIHSGCELRFVSGSQLNRLHGDEELSRVPALGLCAGRSYDSLRSTA